MLDLNIHCEDFFLHFLNMLFNWKLENLNSFSQNYEGIDLIDRTNNLIVQISSSGTKDKIDSSLNKAELANYSGYNFKFFCVGSISFSLKNKSFPNPFSVIFSPLNDIYDIESILRTVKSLDVNKQENLRILIEHELEDRIIDLSKLDSNLTSIINILTESNLNKPPEHTIKLNNFDIENKITFNRLIVSRFIIDDFKVYCSHIDKIYQEYDRQGLNKSTFVLQSIRNQYIEAVGELGGNKEDNSDNIFKLVINKVNFIVINSANFAGIPSDELDFYIGIIVVDAFIRCKIFKNPEDYNYVATR